MTTPDKFQYTYSATREELVAYYEAVAVPLEPDRFEPSSSWRTGSLMVPILFFMSPLIAIALQDRLVFSTNWLYGFMGLWGGLILISLFTRVFVRMTGQWPFEPVEGTQKQIADGIEAHDESGLYTTTISSGGLSEQLLDRLTHKSWHEITRIEVDPSGLNLMIHEQDGRASALPLRLLKSDEERQRLMAFMTMNIELAKVRGG